VDVAQLRAHRRWADPPPRRRRGLVVG